MSAKQLLGICIALILIGFGTTWWYITYEKSSQENQTKTQTQQYGSKHIIYVRGHVIQKGYLQNEKVIIVQQGQRKIYFHDDVLFDEYNVGDTIDIPVLVYGR